MQAKVFTFSLMFGNLHFYLFSEHQRFSSLEGRGLWGEGMLPKKVLSLGFQRWPLFIFPCKFLIKSALHVVKTFYFYFAKPASNNIVFYSLNIGNNNY